MILKVCFQQLNSDLEKHLNQERDRERDIKGMNPKN